MDLEPAGRCARGRRGRPPSGGPRQIPRRCRGDGVGSRAATTHGRMARARRRAGRRRAGAARRRRPCSGRRVAAPAQAPGSRAPARDPRRRSSGCFCPSCVASCSAGSRLVTGLPAGSPAAPPASPREPRRRPPGSAVRATGGSWAGGDAGARQRGEHRRGAGVPELREPRLTSRTLGGDQAGLRPRCAGRSPSCATRSQAYSSLVPRPQAGGPMVVSSWPGAQRDAGVISETQPTALDWRTGPRRPRAGSRGSSRAP